MVRFAVEYGIFRDIFSNIGDMDSEFEIPIREFLYGDSIVQILRIRSVDGDDPLASEVYS